MENQWVCFKIYKFIKKNIKSIYLWEGKRSILCNLQTNNSQKIQSFQTTFSENPYFFLIQFGMCFNQLIYIFIPNYMADRITSKSQLLLDAVYDPTIFYRSREFKKISLILMEFLKYPLEFSLCGIFALNLEEFVEICNASYSLYSIVKNLNV